MGLLDDAIREHLDLKRRRGADPAEVERAEREALGPVRRGPEPLDEEPVGELPRQDRPAGAYDHDASADFVEDESTRELSAYDHAEDDEFDLAEDDLADADDPADEDDLASEPPIRAGSFEAASPPTRRPAPELDGESEGETAEFDVERALAREEPEQAGESEDVLEETPEFLQDAPEHDRLWFEQRPPRDFDFDR